LEAANFRHEFKYCCSEAQLACLQHRLGVFLKTDQNADEAGKYSIRSMYFDDMYDTCFYENENGTDPREKFRIRFYEQRYNLIRLECKRKVNGMTQKLSCKLDKETCEKILSGKDAPGFLEMQPDNPVWNLFANKWNTDHFRPSVIVEYDRTTYVCEMGNVRITFDRNVSSASANEYFFEPRLMKRPVMPTGMQLLEVKYDQYLPDYIYKSLELDSLQRTAYSKYYLCRKFTIQSRDCHRI